MIYTYKEIWYSKVFFSLKERLSRNYRKELQKKRAYEYMKEEWKNNNPSYVRYFDQWFGGITDYQLSCIRVWMEGKLGPFEK